MPRIFTVSPSAYPYPSDPMVIDVVVLLYRVPLAVNVTVTVAPVPVPVTVVSGKFEYVVVVALVTFVPDMLKSEVMLPGVYTISSRL